MFWSVAGAEVTTPEIALPEVDVAVAALSVGCVLAVLLSVDLLSLSDELAVRAVAVLAAVSVVDATCVTEDAASGLPEVLFRPLFLLDVSFDVLVV